MSLVKNIHKRSVDLILKEIREKGFSNVADPEACIKKVKKYTGIELINDDFMLKFKKKMINITQEDNMELMARYPDNHFSLAIVDPPYNVGASER